MLSIAIVKALFFNSKVLIFFLFLHKNICCGYWLEVPHWGTSNEYPQPMFSRTYVWRNKKNYLLDAHPYLDLWLSLNTGASLYVMIEFFEKRVLSQFFVTKSYDHEVLHYNFIFNSLYTPRIINPMLQRYLSPTFLISGLLSKNTLFILSIRTP